MKDKIFKIRVSSEDLAEIQRRAKLSRTTMSNYIRLVSIGNTLVVVEETIEFLHELRKIGGNLNQLAILAHQGRISCVGLDSTNVELHNIYSGLYKLGKHIRRSV